MDYSKFYFNKLSERAKVLYALYERHFANYGLFPYSFKIDFNPTDKELGDSYKALYLDEIYLQMIPSIHLKYSVKQKNIGTFEIEVYSEDFSNYTLTEIEATEKIISKKRKDFSSLITSDEEQRRLVTGICKFLYETSCYRIRPDGKGESPIDVLLEHNAHCVGFARTTKLFFPECKIEKGCIKHEFSLVKDSEDPNKDIGHMFCSVLNKDNKTIYFDPTIPVNIADSVVKRELDNGYYRKAYGENDFFAPEFLNKGTLLKKYTLEGSI